MDDAQPLRVGDRERGEVDARLQTAHVDGVLTLVEYDERAARCHAARFRHELDPLVADLPAAAGAGAQTDAGAAGPPPDPPAASPPSPAPLRRHDRDRPVRHRGVRAIVLAGAVAVAAVVAPGVLAAPDGAAVFGSRTVQVAPGTTSTQVGVLFGSTEVVVPDGTTATTSGTTIFGSVTCRAACAPGPPGAPRVDVGARGAFGSVDVRTATEAARDDADRDGSDD